MAAGILSIRVSLTKISRGTSAVPPLLSCAGRSGTHAENIRTIRGAYGKTQIAKQDMSRSPVDQINSRALDSGRAFPLNLDGLHRVGRKDYLSRVKAEKIARRLPDFLSVNPCLPSQQRDAYRYFFAVQIGDGERLNSAVAGKRKKSGLEILHPVRDRLFASILIWR